MSQPPTTFEKLLEPISSFVCQQNQSLKKHPNQKLDYVTFFTLLLYFLSSGTGSLKLFVVSKLNLNLLPAELGLQAVPYSTLQDAFSRFSNRLFQDAFYHLVRTLPLKTVPEFASLGLLCCVDGSLFPLINSMDWSPYTSGHQALKLHCCFELNRMIPIDFQITAGCASERKSLLLMAIAGVTYIADRGYMSFDLCYALVEKQAFFILRTKNNLATELLEHLPINLPASAQGLFTEISDYMIRYANDKQGATYRLISFNIHNEAYHLVTNRFDLTTFQVIMLYAYRWQIELLFRYIKRTLNGIHLIRHDFRGATIQFYTMMIMVLLKLRLKQYALDSVPSQYPTPKKSKISHKSVNSRLDEESFLQSLGQTVSTYWKIGIHWLTVLREVLARPFDHQVISLLCAAS